jgi:hypothetical protein
MKQLEDVNVMLVSYFFLCGLCKTSSGRLGRMSDVRYDGKFRRI